MDDLRKNCLDLANQFSRLGLDFFSIQVKSKELNLYIESDKKVGKSHSAKKKSPSSLKRSYLRKQLFLQRKMLNQKTSQTPINQPPDSTPVSGATITASLASSPSIRCDNCDKSFKSTKSLSIHQAKLHGSNILQLDGSISVTKQQHPVEINSYGRLLKERYTAAAPEETWDDRFERRKKKLLDDLEAFKSSATIEEKEDSGDDDLQNDELFAKQFQKAKFNF